MNTYKIKALNGRAPLKLQFTVDAETLLEAQEAGRKKLARDGFKYALIDTIVEVGPSKEALPAQTELREALEDMIDLWKRSQKNGRDIEFDSQVIAARKALGSSKVPSPAKPRDPGTDVQKLSLSKMDCGKHPLKEESPASSDYFGNTGSEFPDDGAQFGGYKGPRWRDE
jgi:hypothetical protein